MTRNCSNMPGSWLPWTPNQPGRVLASVTVSNVLNGTACIEAAVKPRFAFGVIVARVDSLLVDVGVTSTQPDNLLSQPIARLRHQVVLAALPVLIAVGEGPLHPGARRFHRVRTNRLGSERRQIAMPIDDLGSPDHNGAHLILFLVLKLFDMRARRFRQGLQSDLQCTFLRGVPERVDCASDLSNRRGRGAQKGGFLRPASLQ